MMELVVGAITMLLATIVAVFCFLTAITYVLAVRLRARIPQSQALYGAE